MDNNYDSDSDSEPLPIQHQYQHAELNSSTSVEVSEVIELSATDNPVSPTYYASGSGSSSPRETSSSAEHIKDNNYDSNIYSEPLSVQHQHADFSSSTSVEVSEVIEVSATDNPVSPTYQVSESGSNSQRETSPSVEQSDNAQTQSKQVPPELEHFNFSAEIINIFRSLDFAVSKSMEWTGSDSSSDSSRGPSPVPPSTTSPHISSDFSPSSNPELLPVPVPVYAPRPPDPAEIARDMNSHRVYPQLVRNPNYRPQITRTPNYRPQLARTPNYRPQLARTPNYRPQLARTPNYRPQFARNPNYCAQLTRTLDYRPQLSRNPDSHPVLDRTPNSSHSEPIRNSNQCRPQLVQRPNSSRSQLTIPEIPPPDYLNSPVYRQILARFCRTRPHRSISPRPPRSVLHADVSTIPAKRLRPIDSASLQALSREAVQFLREISYNRHSDAPDPSELTYPKSTDPAAIWSDLPQILRSRLCAAKQQAVGTKQSESSYDTATRLLNHVWGHRKLLPMLATVVIKEYSKPEAVDYEKLLDYVFAFHIMLEEHIVVGIELPALKCRNNVDEEQVKKVKRILSRNEKYFAVVRFACLLMRVHCDLMVNGETRRGFKAFENFLLDRTNKNFRALIEF